MDHFVSNEKIVSNPKDGEQEHALHKFQKYREILANLPKDELTDSEWTLYQYQGFWYFPTSLQKIIFLQENFKVDPTDILICSSPKSGTTWLKSLSFAITARKRFDEASNPLFKAVSHDIIPLLEYDIAIGSPRDPKLPLLGTHLAYAALPKSVITENCKIAYVCRDPKDLVVSLWHFEQKFSFPGFVKADSLEKTVEMFCEGKTYYGPYWEHVLGYWKASQERPQNVLFLKYEDMMLDTLSYVKKIAEFFDQAFSQEEEMEGVPQKIMDMCSFEKLSNLQVIKSGKHREGAPIEVDNSVFFRKGQVGDWKNHLTQEMKEKIDQTMDEKLHGSGFRF